MTAGRDAGDRWRAPTSSSVAVGSGGVPDRYREAFDYALTLCPQLPAPVFAAQITQESGWKPDAVSPVGARGLGQFMPGTWAEHAVDANGGGAVITDPADSLASAASYDCYLLEQVTGRGYREDPVSLMLAAYNAGPGTVQRYRGVPPPSFSPRGDARVRAGHHRPRRPAHRSPPHRVWWWRGPCPTSRCRRGRSAPRAWRPTRSSPAAGSTRRTAPARPSRRARPGRGTPATSRS
ncbi:MAG: lytic transglycosylase domain-containing protein [Quadrisphaera sp.]